MASATPAVTPSAFNIPASRLLRPPPFGTAKKIGRRCGYCSPNHRKQFRCIWLSMCRGFAFSPAALAAATNSSKVRRVLGGLPGRGLGVGCALSFSRRAAAQDLLQHFPQPRAILRVSAWNGRPQCSQILVTYAIFTRVCNEVSGLFSAWYNQTARLCPYRFRIWSF